MTSLIQVERKICLSSEFLNKDYKKHLFNKIQKFKNECTKEHGFFININKILKIKDGEITSNCENLFKVLFEVESLKPEVGKIFEGTVCMIFDRGIFIIVNNILKILILEDFLKKEGYSFNQPNNSFDKKNLSIKQEDKIKVKLTGVTYTKQNFVCFGVLV